MRILGIETSCDETSVSIVQNGVDVLSNVIATSQARFAKLAGVIPEVAARRQIECIIPVLEEALTGVASDRRTIEAIAVTKGPGLLTSLLVGTMTARVLADTWHLPLIGVHHTLGHLSSTWLGGAKCVFPILTLSASGGHTDLWYRTSHTRGTLLGRTRDDAAGEAFDKGANLLELPYPGGPAIAELAREGNPTAFEFPRPLAADATLDFSFSGLKTALKYLLRDLGREPSDAERRDIAASFQRAINAHLIARILETLHAHPRTREVHIVGGVSANTALREELTQQLPDSATLRWPRRMEYCTDNAAMIAAAAEFLHQELGERAFGPFETAASLPLEEVVSANMAGSPQR
jgi:N6-L-threonylcarbamoyladenine synthase